MFGSVDSDVDRWIIIPAGHVRNLFDMEEYLSGIITHEVDVYRQPGWLQDIIISADIAACNAIRMSAHV